MVALYREIVKSFSLFWYYDSRDLNYGAIFLHNLNAPRFAPVKPKGSRNAISIDKEGVIQNRYILTEMVATRFGSVKSCTCCSYVTRIFPPW